MLTSKQKRQVAILSRLYGGKPELSLDRHAFLDIFFSPSSVAGASFRIWPDGDVKNHIHLTERFCTVKPVIIG